VSAGHQRCVPVGRAPLAPSPLRTRHRLPGAARLSAEAADRHRVVGVVIRGGPTAVRRGEPVVGPVLGDLSKRFATSSSRWSPCGPAPGEPSSVRPPGRTGPRYRKASHGHHPVRLRKPLPHLPHHASAASPGRTAPAARARGDHAGRAHPARAGPARGGPPSPGHHRRRRPVRAGGRRGDRHARLQGGLLRPAQVAARPVAAVRAGRKDRAAAGHRRQQGPRPGHRLRAAPRTQFHGRLPHRARLVHPRHGRGRRRPGLTARRTGRRGSAGTGHGPRTGTLTLAESR
jgi:hypothetical protein